MRQNVPNFVDDAAKNVAEKDRRRNAPLPVEACIPVYQLGRRWAQTTLKSTPNDCNRFGNTPLNTFCWRRSFVKIIRHNSVVFCDRLTPA